MPDLPSRNADAAAHLPVFHQPLIDIQITPESAAAGPVKSFAAAVPYLVKGRLFEACGQMIVMKAREPVPAAEHKRLEIILEAVFR